MTPSHNAHRLTMQRATRNTLIPESTKGQYLFPPNYTPLLDAAPGDGASEICRPCWCSPCSRVFFSLSPADSQTLISNGPPRQKNSLSVMLNKLPSWFFLFFLALAITFFSWKCGLKILKFGSCWIKRQQRWKENTICLFAVDVNWQYQTIWHTQYTVVDIKSKFTSIHEKITHWPVLIYAHATLNEKI